MERCEERKSGIRTVCPKCVSGPQWGDRWEDESSLGLEMQVRGTEAGTQSRALRREGLFQR